MERIWRFLGWLWAVLVAFFAVASLTGAVLGNWDGAAFCAAWMAAATAMWRTW